MISLCAAQPQVQRGLPVERLDKKGRPRVDNVCGFLSLAELHSTSRPQKSEEQGLRASAVVAKCEAEGNLNRRELQCLRRETVLS